MAKISLEEVQRAARRTYRVVSREEASYIATQSILSSGKVHLGGGVIEGVRFPAEPQGGAAKAPHLMAEFDVRLPGGRRKVVKNAPLVTLGDLRSWAGQLLGIGREHVRFWFEEGADDASAQPYQTG